MNDLPWLSLLMVVPLTGAAVVAVLPSSSAALARPIALGSALVTLVLGIIATATSFTRGSTEQFQMVEQHEWIPQLGVSYSLGVDGISLALILMALVLVPLLISVVLCLATPVALIGLLAAPLMLRAIAPVRAKASGPALIPSLASTGIAMLAWAVLTAIALAVGPPVG